ncbi:MAG: alpha/beta hydrolase [Pseudomonadota bacterium]|nr:alpha/beta hydrolase [Pseudomonadota bacterium]
MQTASTAHRWNKVGRTALAAATAFALTVPVCAPAAASAATSAPAKASVSKVSSTKADQVSASVGKVAKAKGYQFAIAKDKSFKIGKAVKTSTKASATFKQLADGETYFVKVRAYKLDGKKKIWGKWSAAKSVVAGSDVTFDISRAASGQASIIDGKSADQVTDADLNAMLAKATGQNVMSDLGDSLVTVNKTADIVYKTVNGKKLTIDLLTPSTATASKPAPLVVFISGGGFTGVNDPGTIDQRMAFAKAGFVVAAVQHRVIPQATMPGPLQDIKSAIRFLKANAASYNIDKDKVAVAGNSAGGYFATMVGVTGNNKTMTIGGKEVALDVDNDLNESSAVNAVIDLYGVSDLTIIGSGLSKELQDGHKSAATTEAMLLAGAAAGKKGEGVFAESMEDKVAAASPYTYIDSDDPDFLIMHGNKDTLVSPVASADLQNRLEAAGVKVDRYILDGAGHGGAKFAQPEALSIMTGFLKSEANKTITTSTTGANDKAAGTKVYAKSDVPTLEQATAPRDASHLLKIDETSKNATYSVKEVKNVVYKQVKSGSSNTPLYMDLLIPSKAADTKAKPTVIYINGGGFTGSDQSRNINLRWEMAQKGYVVASVQHRTVPQATMPGPLQDVKAAVRFVRANADVYGVDKSKVYAWGNSSGGYFATMLGVTGNTKSIEVNGQKVALDEGDNLDESSAVSAVIDYYGVSDLTIIGACLGEEFESAHHGTSNTEALLVNGAAFGTNAGATVFDPISSGNKAAYYRPFTYIDKNDPKFLILHGDKDTLVSPVASYELANRLSEVGVSAKRITIPGAGHGGPNFEKANVYKTVIDFLDAQSGK